MIEFRPGDLKELLEESIAAQSVLMKEKNITIQANLNPSTIFGDHDLLQSLIFNIFDNSRKASEPGQKIEVSLIADRDWITLSIRDFGRGMNQSETEKVTQPFYMVDKSRSRKAGGAGLGLPLCAEIVQLHQGLLQIDSQPGKGCLTVIKFKKGENSGGICATFPLLLNFFLTAMYLPAILPQTGIGMYPLWSYSLWAELFYSHPAIYIAAYLMLDFVVFGL